MAGELDFQWDDLRVFLAAYRTRSLTSAARKLGINQSTCSRRVAALEDAVGSRLFDRTGSGLVPTELAERLVAAAERAEEASRDVLRAAGRSDSDLAGDVRLALSEAVAFYVLAPAMQSFRERHPGIRLTYVASNAIADLTRREADVAVRTVRPARGDLISKRVLTSGYAVFASPSFVRKLGRAPYAFDELDFITWDRETLGHLPEASWEERVCVRSVASATSFNTRVALAQASVGAVELPRTLGHTVPNLVELETAPVDVSLDVWVVAHRALADVPRIRAVWEFVERNLERFRDDRSADRSPL